MKNALVKSDSKIAAEKAGELVEKVGAADMGKMEEKAHLTWMKLYKKIETNATAISIAKAEQAGYRIRNPKEVSIMPKDMPNEGFYPN